LLVDPSVNVCRCLCEIGQVAVLERGGISPLVAILVDAFEGRIEEVPDTRIPGPYCGSDIAIAKAVHGFVVVFV
jgi:hypothetical protein